MTTPETAAGQRTRHRSRHIALYLGSNQYGKTHLLKRHQKHWAAQNPESPVFGIGKRAYWKVGAETQHDLLYPYVEELTNHGMGPSAVRMNPRVGLSGALVELDDADAFLPKRDIEKTPWGVFFTENAHLRLDVQLTAHRPQTLSKEIIGAAHHIYLFFMGEKYAQEYLRSLSGLEDSEVLRLKQFPKRKGQYIHVVHDPDAPQEYTARYFDEYDPRLESAA